MTQTITINNQDYAVADLSEAAKAQIANIDVSKCPKRHFMRQMTQNLTKSGAEVALDTAGQ